jgi:formylglycine-generating enzyme required for sulfatase activity
MELLTLSPISIQLVPVPSGSFTMGSDNRQFSEAPPRTVHITTPFLLGKFPVTREQWQVVMGNDPSEAGTSPDCPVDGVSWDAAVEFCDRLSELSRGRVRLPSEAEWEYACRAGTTADYFFGPWGPFADDTEVSAECERALWDYAWFDATAGDGTRPVGQLLPNPWGLHDLLGNVWEWCADVWHDGYVGAPIDGFAWMTGADRQPRRCLRGGAWDMNAFRCRSAYRSFDHRTVGTSRFGFRVVVEG